MSPELEQSLGPPLFWDFLRRKGYGLGPPHQWYKTELQKSPPCPPLNSGSLCQFLASLDYAKKDLGECHKRAPRRAGAQGMPVSHQITLSCSWKGSWGQEDLGFLPPRDISEMESMGTLS